MLRDPRARWQRSVLASKLPDGAKVTCCALREFLDRDGIAWPSYATLATLTSQSRRAVINHIHDAETVGLLRVERLPRANVYHVIHDPEPSSIVNVDSPSLVNVGSPVMVNASVSDGERQRQMMVNGGSPEIYKRNIPRNGEAHSALQSAVRSPGPMHEEVVKHYVSLGYPRDAAERCANANRVAAKERR